MRYPEYLQAVRLNLNLEIPRFAFVRKQEVAISVFTLSIRTFPCRITLRHRGIAAAVLACLMAAPSQLQAADVTQPVTSADIGDKMSLTLAQLSRDFGVQGTIPARQFHQRIATTAQAHPSLLSAVEQNETARAFVRESYSAWLPQISTSVDGRITRTDTLGDYQLAETQHNSDYNVTLRQMVFDFGAAAAGVSSARARSRGAAERLSTKEAEVALQAITAYLEVLKSRQLMALAVDNVDVTVEQWGIVVLITDVGLITTKHPALTIAIQRTALAMAEGAKPVASIYGMGKKTSVSLAALVNVAVGPA